MVLRNEPIEGSVAVIAVSEKYDPEEVASKTDELLDRYGWCMWECSELGREAVIITRGAGVRGYPGGYPVYTEAEIIELSKVDISMIRLVHEAKVAGAVIIKAGGNR